MDRDRVLEKIKKCFALASNKGATPGEAAAALRSAQRMMEMHQISEAEVDQHEYTNETVQVPIQVNPKKMPQHLSFLISTIQRAFGVKAVVESEKRISDYSYVIRYFGPKDRVMLATYAHTVVFRAMMNSWTQFLRERPNLRGARGARTSFLMGWMDTVRDTIVDFGYTEEERKLTDLVKEKHYGRELQAAESNKQVLYGSILNKGREAAEGFILSTPVGQETLKIEN